VHAAIVHRTFLTAPLRGLEILSGRRGRKLLHLARSRPQNL
jgi:hypothetical protein